jgi:hypothetical protein
VIVSPTRPPNYEAIVKAFPVVKTKHGIIFTYGSTIHNPDRIEITPDLFAHEEVHERQQGEFPAGWWDMYINNPGFRFEQELEAYRAQFRFAQDNYNRDRRRVLLRHISKTLAGPMYGSLVSPDGARRMITS